MTTPRLFRFGLQLRGAETAEVWATQARRGICDWVLPSDAMEKMAPLVAALSGR